MTTTVITLVIVVLLTAWVIRALTRPFKVCPHCDRGRIFNSAHTRYDRGCPGYAFGKGSCGGTGEKVYWDTKLLRRAGFGKKNK